MKIAAAVLVTLVALYYFGSAELRRAESERAAARAAERASEAEIAYIEGLVRQAERAADLTGNLVGVLTKQLELTQFLTVVVVVWASVLIAALVWVIITLVRRLNRIETALFSLPPASTPAGRLSDTRQIPLPAVRLYDELKERN